MHSYNNVVPKSQPLLMTLKSTLLLLLASAVACTATAANRVNHRSFDKDNLPLREMKAPASRSSEVTDVIYEAEGTMQMTLTTATGTYVFMETLMYYENETVSNHIVYGEDGEVYFYNLLPYAGTDTYVKGQIEGDQVVVELPQTLLVHPSGNYAVNLDILKFSTDTYIPTEDKNSITFTIGEDQSLTLEELDDDFALGYIYTDNNDFAGYSVHELYITPFDETPVELPDDAEPEQWGLISGTTGYMIDVAIVGDEIYFGSVFPDYFPDSWIKGTIVRDDDKVQVKVANRQFLGIDYDYPCYLFFTTEGIDTDDEYEEPEFMDADYEFVFDFNEAEKLLTPVDEEIMWIVSDTDEFYMPYEEITRILIHYQEGFAGTPANPYNLYYLNTDFNKNGFIFYIPAVSYDYKVLDPDYLYYRVYVNGELFTFDAELYELDEDMDTIPYDFGNENIQNYGGPTRWIWMFEGGIETLGVQSVYKYDGVETVSENVSLTLESGIESAVAERNVISETYYDISGRIVATPGEGFYIVKRTFSDGSCETAKIINK